MKALVFAALLLTWGAICQQIPIIANNPSVTIAPYGSSAADLNEAVNLALNSCQGRELLNGTRYRIINSEFVSDPMPGYGDMVKASIDQFRLTVYDYTRGFFILWNGIPAPDQIFFSLSNMQLFTNEDEIAEAARIAGHGVNSDEGTVHSSMPPVITREFPDGTSHRILNIVINSGTSSKIVEVNMNNRTVVTPEVPVPGELACTAPYPASGAASGKGVPGTAEFTISQNGVILWTFEAIRPSSSSGLHGSGIELREVKYKDKTVLYRANVPVLNVEYEQANRGCGPYYRDWQWDEFFFQCNGNDLGPGFRMCNSPARTILDPPCVDGGNFRGVAVYIEGQEVVLKSVLSAGWYRYVSEWRFGLDGSLKPRWGFDGVLEGHQCVCVPHHHHVYWRLDFDIETAGNNLVREFNNPPLIGSMNYHDVVYEVRRLKDPLHHRHWEISHKGKRAYALIPGPNDGTSTAFGVGDVWVLQYHGNELDDGLPAGVVSGPPGQVMEHIDNFLNGEVVRDKDVVIWYSAHFRHDQSGGHQCPGGHIVGPEIRPIKWW